MSLRYCIYLLISSVCLLIPGSLSLTSPRSGTGEQSFIREPSDQIAIVGEHVTLPCRVVNKKGELQWTRDGFGLGVERNLTGFSRYHMIGSDEEVHGCTFYYPLTSSYIAISLQKDLFSAGDNTKLLQV
uniref:Ig-like domain-containing protein n=1 Tax=Lepeophtheirus salmonis TaxID=72036 RepID=A0A0K2TC33_LEPSM